MNPIPPIRALANRTVLAARSRWDQFSRTGAACWQKWRTQPACTIAINMRPVAGPWGGSSVFVHQLTACLRRRGCHVQYHLSPSVDVIVLIDPREESGLKPFGPAAIREFKRRHPRVQVLHRINECDQRKNSSFMDRLLEDANQDAHYTVFISEWLREYFASRWFNPSRPHSVIYNGADPAIFHPIGQRPFQPGGPFVLSTHHWSDNPMKGFPVYEQVDALIAEGRLPGVELWVIGRWPASLKWKSARTFPPASGHQLAALLRQCHAHITASLWEPCGMHHVEGAQCGLPMVYHEDGGGIVEAARRYGIAFRSDPAAAILSLRDNYAAYHRQVLARAPDGDTMVMAYANIIRQLVLQSRAS